MLITHLGTPNHPGRNKSTLYIRPQSPLQKLPATTFVTDCPISSNPCLSPLLIWDAPKSRSTQSPQWPRSALYPVVPSPGRNGPNWVLGTLIGKNWKDHRGPIKESAHMRCIFARAMCFLASVKIPFDTHCNMPNLMGQSCRKYTSTWTHTETYQAVLWRLKH